MNDYKTTRLHLIESAAPQITKILYRPACGLIMGCFRGYIEVFDRVSFTSKWKWDNTLKSIASGDRHKKDKEVEERKKDLAFDTRLTDGLDKAGVADGLGKHTSASVFSLGELEAASEAA